MERNITIRKTNERSCLFDGCGCFVDIDGNPIERTPFSHPYSYDAYVVYKADDYNKKDTWVYSDRLLQWDRGAFKTAVREVWPDKSGSQTFSGRKPEDINRFLSLYFGKEVRLTAIQQACNVSTGYPCWIFAYRES